MKIIVLEDEPIIRQGIIHKLNSLGMPLTVIGEAGDGVEGLELVRTLKPDMVMTDIQMPSMNGLDFIRAAKEITPLLHFLIISGYDNFEYAKQAIQYGVTSYLLKPLENDELSEVLMEWIERKKDEDKLQKSFSELRTMEKESREFTRQHALTKFIQEGDIHVIDESLQSLEKSCTQFTAVVILLEPVVLPHCSFAANEKDLLWFAIKNIVIEQFEANELQGVLIHHSLRQFELVFVVGLASSQTIANIRHVLEHILFGIRSYLKLDIKISVGSIIDQISRIQDCYREAKLSGRDAILHGGNRIYYYDAAIKNLNPISLISEEDEKLLFIWLEQWELEKINKWIDRRIGAIVQDQQSVYVQLEWFCLDLFLLYHKYVLTHAADSDWTIGDRDDLLHWLQEITDWRQAAEQLKRFTRNIIGYLSKAGQLAGKDMMEAIRVFIETHYKEPLSLQSISERFYIHPNYFSKRFKEKFGLSFIDYLTSIRMRHASQLLRSTDLKIHQIADHVGFEDTAYFGSVFRKAFHMTPKQYREQPTT